MNNQVIRFRLGPCDGQEFPAEVLDPRSKQWFMPVDQAVYRLLKGEKLHVERHADLFEKPLGMAAVYERSPTSNPTDAVVYYDFVKSITGERHKEVVKQAMQKLDAWREHQKKEAVAMETPIWADKLISDSDDPLEAIRPLFESQQMLQVVREAMKPGPAGPAPSRAQRIVDAVRTALSREAV